MDAAAGPIVTATEVSVGGVSLGLAMDHARLVERLRGVPATATLAYTDDAHADLVIEVARTLVETGHSHVELVSSVGGKRVTTCRATAAAADATAIQIVIEAGKIDLGLGAVLTVLHPVFGDGHLGDDLGAPFFDKATAIEVTAAPGITGKTLSSVLGVACEKVPAVRFGDFATIEAARKAPRVLPLCRKLISQTPATTYDPKLVVQALPDLYAMDLCYNHFEPHPGPIGTVTMTLEIERDGTVGKPAATGLGRDTDRCIAWLLGRSTFAQLPAKPVTIRATAECNTRCCNGD